MLVPPLAWIASLASRAASGRHVDRKLTSQEEPTSPPPRSRRKSEDLQGLPMELAGLEPATSWVRSGSVPDLHGWSVLQGVWPHPLLERYRVCTRRRVLLVAQSLSEEAEHLLLSPAEAVRRRGGREGRSTEIRRPAHARVRAGDRRCAQRQRVLPLEPAQPLERLLVLPQELGERPGLRERVAVVSRGGTRRRSPEGSPSAPGLDRCFRRTPVTS
jgi:hypothetical protein